MSDFSFMRTGLNDGESLTSSSADFMRMVVSLMAILCEEALGTAAAFAKSCGRCQVTPQDTILALKYESHFLWNKDIDSHFIERLSNDHMHSYDTEDTEDTEDTAEDFDEGSDVAEESGGEEEAFTDTFVCGNRALYDRVISVATKWDEWQPADTAKRMLKTAIDKTERDCILRFRMEHGTHRD